MVSLNTLLGTKATNPVEHDLTSQNHVSVFASTGRSRASRNTPAFTIVAE